MVLKIIQVFGILIDVYIFFLNFEIHIIFGFKFL